MTLAGSGVTFPSYNFEVCRRLVTPVEPRQEASVISAFEDMGAEYNMLTVDAEAEASDEDFEDAHESFGVEEDMFESDAASTQTHKQQPLSKRLTRDSRACWLLIAGNTTLDELMTHLIRAVDLFNQQQIAEIAEEVERNARESVKREQDDAYQLSLAVDRAKAEAKRRGEKERRKQVEDEARKNELIEEKRREDEAEKE
ncbi:hypothetical protein LSAT2_005039, partial [Lamellibrachia satsuma]